MSAGLAANLAASLVGLITALTNFVTDLFLTPPLRATLKHLEEAELKALEGGESEASAEDVARDALVTWNKRPVLMCRQK